MGLYKFLYFLKDVPPFSPSHLEYKCPEKLQPFCNQEEKAKNLQSNPDIIELLNLCQFLCFVCFVHTLSCVRLFETPWTAVCQLSLSFTVSWSLLELTSIKSVTPSNTLILCCPLLFLNSIFPRIRVLSNELALHIRWPNLLAL